MPSIDCQTPISSNSEIRPVDLKGFPIAAINCFPDTTISDSLFLRQLAADTWKFFDAAVVRGNDLPIDYMWINPDRIGSNTSITNIGLYLLSVVSAWDLGFIVRNEALERIKKTLQTVIKFETYHGFHYNWYNLKTLKPSRQYISSVDAGWFYSAITILEQTFPKEVGTLCRQLLHPVDFGWLYNDRLGHFSLGYDVEKEEFSPYHYSMIASEARIVSYLALIRGDVPVAHWERLYTTLPDSFSQAHTPEYESGTGYYRYENTLVIPAWGGSLFEYLMPTLLVDEQRLTVIGLGENNRRAVQIHIDYATRHLGYLVWGLSPSTTPKGKYAEFGVSAIASKVGGYSERVVSPHASILAIAINPRVVVENLKKMLQYYPLYGEFGFYDCVDPNSGEVGQAYLTLNQAMILISINNYLNNGIMVRRLESVSGFTNVQSLLSKHRLF